MSCVDSIIPIIIKKVGILQTTATAKVINNSEEGQFKLDSTLRAAYGSSGGPRGGSTTATTSDVSASDVSDAQNGKVLIHKGNPLFVDLEGNTIPYDGSHGSPVCLKLVNEGGYYYKSSGTGIAFAARAYFDLEIGLLVREEVLGEGSTSTTNGECK